VAQRDDWGGESVDRALPRLEEQLDLAAGFWLGFIFSAAPQQVAVLRQRTKALLESAGRTVVVRMLTEPAQVAEILPWLLTDAEVAKAGCTWIETSRADSPGADSGPWSKAWDDLFLRTNERRNALRERLTGGLMFAMPPGTKPRLRDAAPDLWSVRSLVIDVVTGRPNKRLGETVRRGMTLTGLNTQRILAPDKGRATETASEQPASDTSSQPDPRFALEEAARRAEIGGGSSGLALLQAAEGFLADGSYERANAEAARAYDLLKGFDVLAATRALWILGVTEEAKGLLREALSHVREAVAGRQRVAPDEVPIEWVDLAGRLAVSCRDYRAANEIYATALQRHRKHLRTKESVGSLKGLLMSLDGIGTLRRETGDLQGAATAIDEAVVVARRIRDLGEDSPEALADLSLELIKLGEIRKERGDLVGAGAAIQEAVTLDRRACQLLDDAPAALRHLSVSLNRLGDLRREVGDLEAAREAYMRALEYRIRVARAKSNTQSLRDVASSLHRLGELEAQMGDVVAAREKFSLAVGFDRGRRARSGDSPQVLHDLAISLYSLGKQEWLAGDLDLAVASFEECAALAAKLMALPDAPPEVDTLHDLAAAELAGIGGRSGDG